MIMYEYRVIKAFFAKGYAPNWPEEVFAIKKVKNNVPWTYVIKKLNGEENVGKFYEKDLQKTNQTQFRVEKTIKKGDQLCFKWKSWDNSFNSATDEEDIVL